MMKKTLNAKRKSPEYALLSDSIIWLENKFDKDIRDLEKHQKTSTKIVTEYRGLATKLKKNKCIIWGGGSLANKRKAIKKERKLGKSMWKLRNKHKKLLAYCDNKSRIFDIGLLFLSALKEQFKDNEA